MTTGVCKECEYWEPKFPEMPNCEVGYCHRYPPTIFGNDTVFPKTFRMSWCGEYKS